MLREYPSMEAARRAFDEYAALEPRLQPLWTMCRRASPPLAANDEENENEIDPFSIDVFAADRPDAGWCAEDYFFLDVKPLLVQLVGWQRLEGPPELRGTEAYDAVYAALFHHALHRPCACCEQRVALRRLRA